MPLSPLKELLTGSLLLSLNKNSKLPMLGELGILTVTMKPKIDKMQDKFGKLRE